MPSEGVSLFRTASFNFNGSYLYFAAVHEENVEQLKLDFDVWITDLRSCPLCSPIPQIKDVVYHAYGWSIRYFMVLRDNYLGSFTHFQTLAEYLDKRNRNLPVGDPVQLKYRPGKVYKFILPNNSC